MILIETFFYFWAYSRLITGKLLTPYDLGFNNIFFDGLPSPPLEKSSKLSIKCVSFKFPKRSNFYDVNPCIKKLLISSIVML